MKMIAYDHMSPNMIEKTTFPQNDFNEKLNAISESFRFEISLEKQNNLIQVLRDCITLKIEEEQERIYLSKHFNEDEQEARRLAINNIYGGMEDYIGKLGVKYFKKLMEGEENE